MITEVNFEETGFFGKLFLDYLAEKPEIRDFYTYAPSYEGLSSAIGQRTFEDEKRQVLVETLNEQYKQYELSEKVKENLHLIASPDTFTITTGHQLNLATGPLFFIYKILTTIRLSNELKNRFPDKNFVPVYWMASEDHDFEEISEFVLFGKKFTWTTEQQGPVGAFMLDGLQEVLTALPEKIQILEDAYLTGENLSQATRKLVNHLFGSYGLIILDPNERKLKNLFKDVIRAELRERQIARAVADTTSRLNTLGYKEQVHQREINLFLLDAGSRLRILKKVHDFEAGNKTFTTEEMEQLLTSNPEKFSPNVVMRPLYQESILPNIAYIGGPAEIAYWLQLKDAFDSMHISFPVLLPRNFVLFIDAGSQARLEKIHLSPQEIFSSEDEWKDKALQRSGVEKLNLSNEKHRLEDLFKAIKDKAGLADRSLEAYVESEMQKAFKQLNGIEKRIEKAQDHKYETLLRQVSKVRQKLFPDGKLQERVENIFSFYINNPSFITTVEQAIDPCTFTFKIIVQD